MHWRGMDQNLGLSSYVTELSMECKSQCTLTVLPLAQGKPVAFMLRRAKSSSLISGKNQYILIEQRNWEHIPGVDRVLSHCLPISRRMTFLLRHFSKASTSSWGSSSGRVDETFRRIGNFEQVRQLSQCVSLRSDKTSKIEEALYATLRDAKITESSYDKVVTWTGGGCEYVDFGRERVRLDRSEIQPGTSGQSGKTIPTYIIDPEEDTPQSFQVPRSGHNKKWTNYTDEFLDA